MSIAASEPALELLGISKRFGATRALADVTFSLRRNSVHALLGENGAGKTTLMRIAYGLTRPDSGEIRLDGSTRGITSAAEAIAAGIGMVHQHYTNVGAMTVAENIAVGRRPGRFDSAGIAAEIREIGARSGLVLDPSARAESLSVAGQQRLEIVKALARSARVLILDEPTAVLAPAEARELLAWLRRFADAGGSVVIITHKLDEALAVADDLTVLRRGVVAWSGPRGDATRETLTAAMLGDVESQQPGVARADRGGESIVESRSMTLRDHRGAVLIHAATFTIRRGDVVGVAGVDGSGHHALLEALAGRRRPSDGELALPGGIAFIPADRQREALVLPMSLTENLALAGAGSRSGRVGWGAMRERTGELVELFDVRGATPDTRASALSGGNQQRFVLARELSRNPALIVAANPTRGLDIRATQNVRDRIVAAAQDGAAVVISSADLDELVAIATRMLVVHGGHVTETAVDREIAGRMMIGSGGTTAA